MISFLNSLGFIALIAGVVLWILVFREGYSGGDEDLEPENGNEEQTE